MFFFISSLSRPKWKIVIECVVVNFSVQIISFFLMLIFAVNLNTLNITVENVQRNPKNWIICRVLSLKLESGHELLLHGTPYKKFFFWTWLYYLWNISFCWYTLCSSFKVLPKMEAISIENEELWSWEDIRITFKVNTTFHLI